ncbi:MAG: potassium channel family protein [Ezakiella massiliensis]
MLNKGKQYLVIGWGRFGSTVATTLEDLGNQVMAIDIDEDALQKIADRVTYSAIVDVTDENALIDIGIRNFDAVIIGISTDFRAAIMSILVAKEMGVKLVECKVADEIQSKVMKKVGADYTIMPEHSVGRRLAYNLTSENVVDQMILSDELSIYEINVPEKWIGKSIGQLDLRKQHGINIIAIKREGKTMLTIRPDVVFEAGDTIILAGDNEIIKHI